MGVQRPDVMLEPAREQRRDVDPSRIVTHLGGSVELERLVLDVKAQAGKGLLVALEERGRAASGDPVQGCDPLLAVKNQHAKGRGRRRRAPDDRAVGLGLPGQQAAHWVSAIQRSHESADLITVPDVAALELRQQHAPRVDLIQNSRQFRHNRLLDKMSEK